MDLSSDSRAARKSFLVADTAFVQSDRVRKLHLVSVFPQTSGDGAYRESLDGLLRRSRLQSACYEELMPRLAPIFEQHSGIHESDGPRLLRLVLVTITALFADRCLRVLHRIRQQADVGLAVVEVEPIADIQWLGQVKGDSASSWQLNQDLIQRIAAALGLATAQVIEKEGYPEYPKSYPLKSMMFENAERDWRWVLRKIFSRIHLYLSRIPFPRKKYLAAGFAYEDNFVRRRGLYAPWGIFHRIAYPTLESGTKDSNLRSRLLAAIEPVLSSGFDALMRKLDETISPRESKALGHAFAQTFMDWYPIGFLEGFAKNIANCSAIVGNPGARALVGSELTGDAGCILSASARVAGLEIIGVQHGGGHHGYIEDMSINGQLEYPQYDKTITWGWTWLDAHLPSCKAIPLPSPRFSAQHLKSDYLKTIKRGNGPLKDVLFLSNLFHRFPPPSTCGQSRPDFIDEVTGSQDQLMRALSDAGIGVDHKPHNMRSVDLYPEHFRRLEAAGGAGYRLIRSTQKGLDVALVKTCKIVLWDQVGSGTVECFVSKVPTIVYWQRIYSRDAPWARELIAGLESCGVIHSDPVALANEISAYLTDPEKWMSDPRRTDAIRRFCSAFAHTDSSWQKVWKRQFAEWAA